MDKTRDLTNSKIWSDSTCAISVWRTRRILLVVESIVLSTTATFPLQPSHEIIAPHYGIFTMIGGIGYKTTKLGGGL